MGSYELHGQQTIQQSSFKVHYAQPLGPQATMLQCSNCRAQVLTRVVQRAGLLTWLICGGLAIIG